MHLDRYRPCTGSDEPVSDLLPLVELFKFCSFVMAPRWLSALFDIVMMACEFRNHVKARTIGAKVSKM